MGPQSIGKNVAGNGTKIHLIMGENDAISVQLTGADVHDSVPVAEMVAGLEGQPISRFVADKAYDSDKIRMALKDAGIVADIPPKKNRIGHRFFDKTVYRWPWRVEAFFGKIKEHRRLAMGVDKLDASYLSFICIALIKKIVC